MTHWRQVLAVGLMTLGLLSCVTKPTSPPIPMLTDLAPSGPRIQRLQILSAESRFELTAVLAHDHERLQLAVLSPNGQRLFTLLHNLDGSQYLPNSTISPPVSAAWLASRLGWALWPEESLESTFTNTAWRLRSSPNRREISFDHKIHASILLSDTCTVIEDFQMNISMSISPLNSDSPCPPV